MRFTRKTIKWVEYGDLEKAIARYLKIEDYELAVLEEKSNDSIMRFDVTSETKETLDNIMKNGQVKQWRTNNILDLMCKDGLIEPGEYLVNISW